MRRVRFTVTARFMASYVLAIILVVASGLVGITGLRQVATGLVAAGDRIGGAASALHEIAVESAGGSAAELEKAADDLLEAERTLADLAGIETATERRVIWIVGITAALVGVAFVIVRNVIGRPLTLLVAGAQHIAAGDLTAATAVTHSGDEIELLGRAFNDMRDSLRALIAKVAAVADSVTRAADGLGSNTDDTATALQQVAGAIGNVAASASQQSAHAEAAGRSTSELRTAIETVATGAQEQVVHVQSSAATIRQMVQHQDELSRSMERIRDDSAGSADAAAKGLTAIRQLGAEMDRIRNATGESMTRLQALSSSATRVSTINDVISEIAEQTNLLALNAAIEAARAGEQGRGFAVVAEEVRKLAERAAASAKEITDLVGAIQTDTVELVAAMDRSAGVIKSGIEMAEQTGGVLEAVAAIVTRTAGTVNDAHAVTVATARAAQEAEAATVSVAAIAEQSSASAEEMAAGADQVLGLVAEVAELAGNNAASAEEVSASVEEVTATMDQVAGAAGALRRLALDLGDAIKRFRVD